MAKNNIIRKNTITGDWEHFVENTAGYGSYWSPGLYGNDDVANNIRFTESIFNANGDLILYDGYYNAYYNYTPKIKQYLATEYTKNYDITITELLPTSENISVFDPYASLPDFGVNLIKNYNFKNNFDKWEILEGNPQIIRDFKEPSPVFGYHTVDSYYPIPSNLDGEFEITNDIYALNGGWSDDIKMPVTRLVQEIDLSGAANIIDRKIDKDDNIVGNLFGWLGDTGAKDFINRLPTGEIIPTEDSNYIGNITKGEHGDWYSGNGGEYFLVWANNNYIGYFKDEEEYDTYVSPDIPGPKPTPKSGLPPDWGVIFALSGAPSVGTSNSIITYYPYSFKMPIIDKVKIILYFLNDKNEVINQKYWLDNPVRPQQSPDIKFPFLPLRVVDFYIPVHTRKIKIEIKYLRVQNQIYKSGNVYFYGRLTNWNIKEQQHLYHNFNALAFLNLRLSIENKLEDKFINLTFKQYPNVSNSNYTAPAQYKDYIKEYDTPPKQTAIASNFDWVGTLWGDDLTRINAPIIDKINDIKFLYGDQLSNEEIQIKINQSPWFNNRYLNNFNEYVVSR